jgi:hypothetical protein
MWDLPWHLEEKSRPEPAPMKLGEEFAECTVDRTITKFKITFAVRGLRCPARPSPQALAALCAEADEFRWVRLEDLHGINLPRPSERALGKILPALE